MNENYSYNPTADQAVPSRWKSMTLGLLALALVIGAYQIFGDRDGKLARMAVAGARLTLAAAPQQAQTEFDRQESPEIYYYVTLRDTPLGRRLELTCDWIDPAGTVARGNHYRTKIVYKSEWTTHCRQQFTERSTPGAWQVRMMLGERVLSASSFVVRSQSPFIKK